MFVPTFAASRFDSTSMVSSVRGVHPSFERRPIVIIVAGALHLDPEGAMADLADCGDLTRQARGTAGCLDFH